MPKLKLHYMSKKRKATAVKPTTSITKKEVAGKEKKPVYLDAKAVLLCGLVFLLPLIFSRSVLDPVIVPRQLLTGFFVLISLLFFYIIPKKSPELFKAAYFKYVFISGIVFGVWSIITLVSAVNPMTGVYEVSRTFFNLALLYIIADIVVQNKNLVPVICRIIVFTGALHAVIGLMQNFQLAFNDLPGANALPYGLMANRNLFASAQAFTIPFVFFCFYTGSKPWKIISSTSFLLITSSIIISQTRSAWLAFMVFFLVFIVLGIVFLKNERKKVLTISVSALVLALALGFLIANTGGEDSIGNKIKERTSSLVGAVADSTESGYSVNDRLSIWKKTTELIKDKPLTGVGVSNWNINILNYGSKGLAWANGDYVPDRVHNIYLQTIADSGFPGLIIFLTYWVLLIIAAFISVKRSADLTQKIISICMIAGLGAVATDGMFSFPFERVEHTLYITLMSGIILANYFKASAITETNSIKGKHWLFWIMLLIAVVNIFMTFKRKQFESALYKVKSTEGLKQPQNLIGYVGEGVNDFVMLDPTGLSLEAKEAMAYRDLKQYPQALEVMKKAMRLNPASPMLYNNLGTIYTEMENYPEAIKAYEGGLKLAPDFVIIKKNLAINYFNNNEFEKAISMVESFDYKQETIFLNIYEQSKAMVKYQEDQKNSSK